MNIRSIARKPFWDLFFIKPIMPGFLRLALSDSLSWNSEKKIGGSIGNFKSSEFASLQINKGLKPIYKDITNLQENGNHITDMLTIADLIQIGGAAAVEYCGGPQLNVK